MTPNKDEVKQWLKNIGKNREWLAGQCGVDKRTVDLWLSSARNIPARAMLIIQKLMEQNGTLGKIQLPLSEKQWELICETMKDQSILQYINEALMNAMLTQTEEKALRQPTGNPATNNLGTNNPAQNNRETNNRARARRQEPGEKSGPWDLEARESDAGNMEYEAEILGNIAAGNLMEGDSVLEPVKIYRPLKQGEYIVRVNGRSMEPKIMDGSLIVLKKYYGPDMPKTGTIVEYNDGRGVTLKRLGKHEGAYTLESVNPHYPDIEPMDGGCISALYMETLPDDK